MESIHEKPQIRSYHTIASDGGDGEPCGMTKTAFSNVSAVPNEAVVESAEADEQSAGASAELGPSLIDGTLAMSRFKRSARKQLTYSGVIWTILCVSLAINTTAGYVVATPMGFGIFFGFMAGTSPVQLSPEELKALQIEQYKLRMTGSHVTRQRRHLLRVLSVSWRAILSFTTLLACFGLLGMYTTPLDNGNSWMPDFDDEDLKPTPPLALWIWFAGFAVIGIIILSLWILMTLGALAYCILAKQPEPVTEPPQLPMIADSLPPVVDSVLTYNALIIFFVGLFKENPMGLIGWLCLAGMLLTIFWFFYRLIRRLLQKEKIQLYIDWTTDVDCMEVDSDVTELLAYREKLNIKCLLSSLGFFLVFILHLCFIPDHMGEKKPRMYLVLVVSALAINNFCIWLVWRR